MIEQPTPEMTQLVLHDLAMEKDRDRWRRALNDCTPGGSEFADDPEYCKAYVRNRQDTIWQLSRKTLLENRELRRVLENACKALRLVRDGAEGKEIKTLARDVVDQLEELNVGRGKQAPAGPGPTEAPISIARKESD
jgi:hypothetical protein